MRLHVGLNLLHLVPGETGGGEVYARRLMRALLRVDPAVRLTLFCGVEAFESISRELSADRATVVRVPVEARSRARRVLAEQSLLPLALRRSQVGLLHNLFTTAPAAPGVAQVTTIHDVIYKRFPESAGARAHGLRILVPLAAKRSRRIITISEAAKRDIVRFLHVRPDRIDVTPLGPGKASTTPVPEPDLRRRFALGNSPLVLTASAKRAHKNLERLIEAITQIEGPHAPVLLLPGYPTAFEPRLKALAGSLEGGDRIRFAGWVDDGTLEGLYRAADCFVFPSLAEGFGLPVLEAMVRGVPVACSDASSLPEVAGDAVLYFDPTDTAGIASAVRRILSDPDLRERLSEAGRARAARFTWEATAEATLRSYERALGRGQEAELLGSPA
jgi:glycosyltransferase involved in cell wall biosynthesis